MSNENTYTREVFDLVVEWCKPLGLKRIAVDFSEDVRDTGAIVVLVEDKREELTDDCLEYLDTEKGKTCWLIIDSDENEFKRDSRGISEVEVF